MTCYHQTNREVKEKLFEIKDYVFDFEYVELQI